MSDYSLSERFGSDIKEVVNEIEKDMSEARSKKKIEETTASDPRQPRPDSAKDSGAYRNRKKKTRGKQKNPVKSGVPRDLDTDEIRHNSTIPEDKLETFRSHVEPYPDLNQKGDNDIVLIAIDSIKPNTLPKPYPTSSTDPVLGWDGGKNFISLPFSSMNVIDGVSQYDLISKQLNKLTKPLDWPNQIQKCIEGYCHSKWWFTALDKFFSIIPEDLAIEYLHSVIPFMARLALSAPDLITQPVPILRQRCEGSVTMSQQQAAALLAQAFFCTFPGRVDRTYILPIFNFNRFFDLKSRCCIEKLKCIFHYFHQISLKMPTGVLTYRRQRAKAPEDWRSVRKPLSEVIASSGGSIEDQGVGMLQIDFANKFIGGGTLGGGAVQEEIRFLLFPEMIVSMLINERMEHRDSIVILGAQRYSDYAGYGNTFKWRAPTSSYDLKRDRFQRLHCEVVAIDALSYPKQERQYRSGFVQRELQKTYSGFYDRDGSKKGVATGNWGCGVYHGNPQLKALIQIISASVHSRPLCYFTFDNKDLSCQLTDIYNELQLHQIHTDELYDLIMMYCSDWSETCPSVFDFIHTKLVERLPETAK